MFDHLGLAKAKEASTYGSTADEPLNLPDTERQFDSAHRRRTNTHCSIRRTTTAAIIGCRCLFKPSPQSLSEFFPPTSVHNQ